MSLNDFQTALADLIRCPPGLHDFDIKNHIKKYNLSEVEKRQIVNLATVDQTEKYGKEMSSQRWQKVYVNLFRLLTFVDTDMVYDLWLYRYEPFARTVEPDEEGNLAL